MNWEERIRLFGAPGPPMPDRVPETHRRREPVTESPPARLIVKSRQAGAIIVGVESSKRSADALALADSFAGSLETPLVLVHNQPREAAPQFLEPPAEEQLTRSVSDSTSAKVEELVGHDHELGIRVTHAVSPATGLLEMAERVNAQLIVVGPSHRSGLGRVRPGSVGELLLSRAPVPVAIAPRGYADEAPWQGFVVSAFDGSPESRLALDWAAHLARSSNRRLRAISVHTPIAYSGFGFVAASVDPMLRSDLEAEQAAAIAGYEGPVETTILDGDAARVLVEASQEADILVMGSRGHGPLQAALLGGVSHYVVRHAACPVVIHPRSAVPEREPEPRLTDRIAEQTATDRSADRRPERGRAALAARDGS
jgi:nucleotide-binding universal stress UspA family protein